MKKYLQLLILPLAILISPAYAFDDGFVISLRADFMGSLTLPKIDEKDLKLLGANKMEGMAGFVMRGEAELDYIFNAKKSMNVDSYYFSGLGWGFGLGVGQGHTGQISGSLVDGKTGKEQVDVFVNVYYTPVINFYTSLRAYMFDGRMTLGTSIGGRMIADPAPTYQMYSTLPSVFPAEVGTMIVEDWQVKKMNPFAFQNTYFIEYNQPIVERMEAVFRLFIGYNIFSPGYISLPPPLAASVDKKILATPLKSFYINSMDFGITLGLNFKG